MDLQGGECFRTNGAIGAAIALDVLSPFQAQHRSKGGEWQVDAVCKLKGRLANLKFL